MANGQQNIIGYGQAQVLPKPDNLLPYADRIRDEQKFQYRQKTYAQEKKERDEKELYGIIGSQLNPKNFNALIHDRVRQATVEMASKLRKGGLSYGDVYMEAVGKAGELGQVSETLNQIEGTLSATMSEYEKYDKRLNTPRIKWEAMKRVVDDLNAGRIPDKNYNYFDDALTNMGSDALVDKSDAVVIDLLPEEYSDMKGDYFKRRLNKTDALKWNVKASPIFYDVVQKSNLEEPQLVTKGVPTGIKEPGMDKMLDEDAYRRITVLPSNRKAIDARVEKKYGNIPKGSQQAEILRRIEAYKFMDERKPQVNMAERDIVSYPPSGNTYNNFFNQLNNAPIDLSEYKPIEGTGEYDITDLMRGVKLTGLITGESFESPTVLYNPETKKFRYYNAITNKTEEKGFNRFIQDVTASNPNIDVKFLTRLYRAKAGRANKEDKPTSTKTVTVILKDGRKGEIPENSLQQFLKDNPGAKKQ